MIQQDSVVRRWRACATPRVPEPAIMRGTRADLEALAPFHYASAHTGPLARILIARDRETSDLAGVLAIAMPTLNATWRSRVWPDLCASPDPRERARLLNGSVRTIARVIVDPRWRAMGIGSALVSAYLADPLTERTETRASSMRAFSNVRGAAGVGVGVWGVGCGGGGGLFERAGMRRVEVPRPARDWPMLDALDALGVVPVALLDPAWRDALLRSPRFCVAMERWLRASRATRHLIDGCAHVACSVLVRALLAPPVVLMHERNAMAQRTKTPARERTAEGEGMAAQERLPAHEHAHASSDATVSLTFHLTPSERRRILRHLRRITPDRARALCTLIEAHARSHSP